MVVVVPYVYVYARGTVFLCLFVCLFVCVHVRACVCACAHMQMNVSRYVWMYVSCIIYDIVICMLCMYACACGLESVVDHVA